MEGNEKDLNFLSEYLGKRIVVVHKERGEERSVIGELRSVNKAFVAVRTDNGSVHAVRVDDVVKVKIKP